ncbi:hypothetical protein TNCT_65371 [Trichonephila clavata]|uniref:Uncharacterized protein n=1 Tax=Trichonephila clavata TaxID=2740835 RepID=A0A8X6LP15_TRICU|nr:hypothetical protein TNCT_65371 [Trichonephila clavata]
MKLFCSDTSVAILCCPPDIPKREEGTLQNIFQIKFCLLSKETLKTLDILGILRLPPSQPCLHTITYANRAKPDQSLCGNARRRGIPERGIK